MVRQLLLLLTVFLTACEMTMPANSNITPAPIWAPGQMPTLPAIAATPTFSYQTPRPRAIGEPMFTPTPDIPHYSTEATPGPREHVVQPGEYLSLIANRYGVSLEALIEANQLTNPDRLEVGQRLILPQPTLKPVGPAFKLIPDSELVYGPVSGWTDIGAFVRSRGGYLASYSQEIYGELLTGAQIVERVARAYSINPRLLLALLEYHSGWVTNAQPKETHHPFGYIDDWYVGLYRQLVWASIHLNSGFYRWRAGEVRYWTLIDGTAVPAAPTINAGTAGVQNFFARLYGYEAWLQAVSPGGFFDTYYLLFGYPFDYAIEPLVPPNLLQPLLRLPFASGEVWSFTGAPHVSWDAGTPWGALDFAPPGDAYGCVPVDAWVTAVADGLVVRSGDGVVALDLDLDGNEGSGWVIVYMHIETRDRAQVGAFVRAGEPIGHPSCEGGISTGTHVHIARKFNGVWLPAEGTPPFVMDGWLPVSAGEEYEGVLRRNGVVVEAFEGRSEKNQISR
ncbi:MAG: LysM peptidoglycan-binding domain-containing protein [Anaerolineales bacterium]|nr:LysM peptidoglycan-binding domain-containing protein [Anaerolineales bacterium]MDW8227619.1 LysM peptidoglycan-binding domain-containing protein [Anaerolineales bacterium]